jgi:hypothetical protein
MSGAMLHGLGDCTPALHCGCLTEPRAVGTVVLVRWSDGSTSTAVRFREHNPAAAANPDWCTSEGTHHEWVNLPVAEVLAERGDPGRPTGGFIARYRAWRLDRKARCRVSTEWCGTFIGRRSCSTHHTRWDHDGPCPAAEKVAL